MQEDVRVEVLKWQGKVADDLAEMIRMVNKLAVENNALKEFVSRDSAKSV